MSDVDELFLGIDDAGRGPVLGPMVLAGCLATAKQIIELKKLGVKDSKELTSKRREFLAKKIKENIETFEITLAYPEEIDESLKNGINLNVVEAIKIAEIINNINKSSKKIKVIIDCPSVSIEKWKDILKTKIKKLSNLEIVCEHKADKNHAIVSAASILAKSKREEEMDILKKKFGEEIGSGYTSDPLTVKFLQKNAEKHKEAGIFRTSWKTWKVATLNVGQKKLF